MKKLALSAMLSLIMAPCFAQVVPKTPETPADPKTQQTNAAIAKSGLTPEQYWHLQAINAKTESLQQQAAVIQEKMAPLQTQFNQVLIERQNLITEATKAHPGMQWDENEGRFVPTPTPAKTASSEANKDAPNK